MNILVYRWKAYHYRDVAAALEQAGHTLDTLFYDIADFDDDPEFCRQMGEVLKNKKYDMVFSINYFTVISNVCQKNNIPYISWNCDSMLISMYHQSVFHTCNYIFSFDMAEVQKFRAMGVKHIFYLPLAADTERLDKVIAEGTQKRTVLEQWQGVGQQDDIEERTIKAEKSSIQKKQAEAQKNRGDIKRTLCSNLSCKAKDTGEESVSCSNAGLPAGEITFVGNLYERNRYDKIEHLLPDYLRGYLEASLWAQLQVSGGNLLQEMLTEDILLQLSDYFKLEKNEASLADIGLIFTSTVLGFKAASMERERYLNALSLRYPIDLYTNSQTGQLPLVSCFGGADYWEEMPNIFHASKINLNFTIPNIIDGTPLRVWDILGCGGFCLTNYRPDLLRHFENGKDLVIFEGKEELLQKAEYYLSHDKEREQIAYQGYQTIKEHHSYAARIKEMFAVLQQQIGKNFLH